MRTFLHGLCTYLTFATLYSYCNAGLLDILLGRNMTPPQQMFNVNNNPSRNPFSSNSQISPNILAATRDRYNARANNWGTRPATENTKLTSNHLTNDIDTGNSDNSDDENRVPRNTNHVASNIVQNTNEQNNHVSGLPFINVNSGNYRPLVNQLPGSEEPSNPRYNSLNPLINRPITNAGNAGNIHKIIQDINKINHIMDQIKQENAKNQGNMDTDMKTNNSNFYNHPSGAFNYPMVHVNNGLQGVHTNLHNGYPSTSNNAQPPRNPETDSHTTVTSGNIVTPPPGILMTNPPKNYPINNVSKIDDRYVLKPITKRKFFSQVRPVVPDYVILPNNETLYYVD